MSPLTLRRYRAERLLRDEFEALRGRVLANVKGRLRAGGASLDQGDLDGCYAQAWQGLYAAILEGQEIENPAGWLALVTFRRAIEELRAQGRAHRGGILRAQGDGVRDGGAQSEPETIDRVCAAERDLASELDDRMRLRQLFEGLCRRLDGREREAATLCYLQGLSRSEAAARMGVSDARMRKLMEGGGRGRPGVAGKVGALVQTIREGQWCEEQGSLMRAFAYGILDSEGERYRLAIMHSDQCSACRAYVASLRGLAVVLPPVFMPWGLGASVLAGAGEGVRAGGASGAGLQAGGGIGGAAAASGAAGAGGAAGGGWLIGAGSLGGKFAVGCLLALGVGAGCVAIEGDRVSSPAPRHRQHAVFASRAGVQASDQTLVGYPPDETVAGTSGVGSPATADGSGALTPATRASREFGPEQALASAASSTGSGADSPAARQGATARAASSDAGQAAVSATDGEAGISATSGSQSASVSGSASSAGGDSAAAEREFSPG